MMVTHDIHISQVGSMWSVLLLFMLNMGCQRPASHPPGNSSTLRAGMHEGIPGLAGFIDLKAALDSARSANRPLFIYFTGYSVVNCRKMEDSVLSSPEIRSLINRHFVVLYQYVDDRKPLAKTGTEDPIDGPKTLGEQCTRFEREAFKMASQPYCGFMDPISLETVGGFGYETDVDRILTTLENALHYFENKRP